MSHVALLRALGFTPDADAPGGLLADDGDRPAIIAAGVAGAGGALASGEPSGSGGADHAICHATRPASMTDGVVGGSPDEGALGPAEKGTTTRAALARRAESLAAPIRTTVPPMGRVGLVDTHDADAVVALVAALVAQRSVAMLGEAGAEAGGITDGHRRLAVRSGCHAIIVGGRLVPVDPPAGDSSVGDDAGPAGPRSTDAPTGLTADAGLRAGDPREAVVLFTSGTTGEPRGVRLSAANLLANLTAVQAATAPWDNRDRLGQMLTITHSFGLSMLLMALARRVPVTFVPPDPGRPLLRALADESVTAFACVPYTLRLLARRRLHLGAAATPALRRLYLAGGGIPEDEITDLLGDFDGELYCMYGFTEAAARVAVRRAGQDDSPAGSVGLPLPGTAVEIVDDAGHVLPPGREGRIRVHSASLMIGYLGESARPPGEPVTTSDLGVLDDAGHLTITGRDEELMNFRGNRVSVVGLEAQAAGLDGVLAARAVPDAAAEDSPCTLQVVLDDGADPAAVRRAVLRDITPRGIVRDIQVVTDLPTTRSGKLLRRTGAGPLS